MSQKPAVFNSTLKQGLFKFIEEQKGDNLYDQLIGTLELQDLNKKILTVFLDIDTTLMAFYDSSLIQEFVKEFYGCYELIPTIICEIVEERIKDYAESEELKKLALYHLGCLTMHVELKVSHFPVIFDKISTKLLSTNENLQRYGHLACLKKVSILHVYDKSFFLLSRKYRSG